MSLTLPRINWFKGYDCAWTKKWLCFDVQSLPISHPHLCFSYRRWESQWLQAIFSHFQYHLFRVRWSWTFLTFIRYNLSSKMMIYMWHIHVMNINLLTHIPDGFFIFSFLCRYCSWDSQGNAQICVATWNPFSLLFSASSKEIPAFVIIICYATLTIFLKGCCHWTWLMCGLFFWSFSWTFVWMCVYLLRAGCIAETFMKIGCESSEKFLNQTRKVF